MSPSRILPSLLIVATALLGLIGCSADSDDEAKQQQPARSVADFKPGSIPSMPAEGEYLPFAGNEVAHLIASVPLKECDLELNQDDRQRYRLLAEYLAEVCAKGHSELEGTMPFHEGFLGFTFPDDLRMRRSQSPNMNWTGINTSASFIAVGRGDSECEELASARSYRDRKNLKLEPNSRMIVLHFEAEHLTGAKNKLAFNFEERPDGMLLHWGMTVSNYGMLGGPGKPAASPDGE